MAGAVNPASSVRDSFPKGDTSAASESGNMESNMLPTLAVLAGGGLASPAALSFNAARSSGADLSFNAARSSGADFLQFATK